MWIAQGRLGDGLGWAREHGLSVEDELSYLREFEHITLARVLLARFGAGRDTTRRCTRHSGSSSASSGRAEQGERGRSVIEILVLQALARDTSGDRAGALASLDRALALAEPEGYVRIFVDEGPAHGRPAQGRGEKRGTGPTYVRRLLAALGTGDDRSPADRR